MIDIPLTQTYPVPGLDEVSLQTLVRTLLMEQKIAHATVSIVVLGDEEMIRLNRQYKQRDRTTDCFSFDLSDSHAPEMPRSYEILVNGQKAEREARARGHAAAAECTLYVVHGLLHQLGYDDQSEAEAAKMHAREDEILHRFGYGVVYNRAEIEE